MVTTTTMPFVPRGGGGCPIAFDGRLSGGSSSGVDEGSSSSSPVGPAKAIGGLALSGALYRLAYDRLVLSSSSVPGAPLKWVLGWTAVNVASSYGWLALYEGGYTDAQKARVRRTHWQDKILAAFTVALGFALDRCGSLGPGTVGGPVALLLPAANLWFTLESKLLTHLWVGTPFHPTWWCDGAVERFAPSNLINLTFALATGLQTIVLTTYAFYAVNEAAGGWDVLKSPLDFASKPLWKILTAHGMAQIWGTGMWMIAASSGVPAWVEGMTFMDVPPIARVDPKDCVPIHKRDLLIGVGLLALGALAPAEAAGALALAGKAAVAVSWGSFLAPKLRAHFGKKKE